MKKVSKVIRIAVLVGILGYAAYFILDFVIFGHSLVWHTKAKEYYWLLSKSAKKRIDTFYSLSYVQRHDVYNYYLLDKEYYVVIWEFQDMRYSDLEDIAIKQNADLTSVKFTRGETLDPDLSPSISIAYGFDFNDGMNILLNPASKVDTAFATSDYKAFYGSINKMLLGNDVERQMILFDYSNGLEYSLFILYKQKKRFFLLAVMADDPFDPMRMIKVFNLPQRHRSVYTNR